MVGTATALFSGLDDMTGCKDKAGAATGLPDIGAVVLGTPEACAPVSFPVIPSQIDCATVGKVPQTYRGNQGVFTYLAKKHKSLNGPFIKTNDSPDAERSTDVLTKAAQHAGINVTSTPVLSNRDQQSAFTTIVTKMKQDGSNWSDNGLAAPGAVLFRQEAALQGLTDPKLVWQCTSACYDQQAMSAAGDVMNGEYVDLGFLPFSESSANKTLAGYLKYVGKDNANAFGVYGFEAVLAFQQAANNAAKSTGGLTRASLLTALEEHHQLQRRRDGGHGEHRGEGAVELLHGRAVGERQVQPGLPDEEGHLRLHHVESLHLRRRPHDPVKSGLRRREGERRRPACEVHDPAVGPRSRIPGSTWRMSSHGA